MNACVAKKALADALAHAARIAGAARGGVKGQVLMTVEPDGLSCAVRNDLYVRILVPATVALGGAGPSIIVPAAVTHQLVATTGHAELQVGLRYHTLSLHAGATALEAQQTVPDDTDFTVDPGPTDVAFTIPAGDLAAAIHATAYAASTEAFQAVFRGLLLEGTRDGLRVVASDGYRVAIADLPAVPPAPFRAVVHASHLREVARLVAGRGDVTLQVGATHVTFRTAHVTIMAPCMDGEFPDWQRVVPTITSTVTLPADALRSSVGRVAVLADKNANNRVELTFTRGRTTVRAAGDYGSAVDTLDATLEGADDAVHLAVNARMLLDALAVADGTAQIGLSGSTTPFVITSEAPGVRALLVTLRA